MIKHLFIIPVMAVIPLAASAQSAIEAINLTQSDMKGTARFMSMGGAFGALGGDLSTLSQNPAGIGVYRSSDIGFTLNLDMQSAQADAQGFSVNTNQTKFLLSNIGAVFTLKLNSNSCPNLNFGFTYNKDASFNRRIRGSFPHLQNSISNYIAGLTNYGPYQNQSWTENDLTANGNYNPWSDGGAPWMAILGYNGFLTTPTGDPDNPNWVGQWGQQTSGSGDFDWLESGSVDSYNIALGGNIANVVYWGMDFDITHMNYNLQNIWTEDLQNAYVEGDGGILDPIKAKYSLNTYYQAKGTGFNYKLGIIVKPIQELRLGFAFHTPTWYNLTEYYGGALNYRYADQAPASVAYNPIRYDDKYSPGQTTSNSFNFRTPWKFMVSAAGVIGGKFIISADYEWTGYSGMRFSEPNDGYYDYGYDNGWDYGYDYDWYYRPAESKQMPTKSYSTTEAYYYSNQDIKDYTQHTNTLRIGAEYRINPKLSVRAGYSFVSSPIKEAARNGQMAIATSDTRPSFRFNNTTNYVTCGIGYKYKHFYADLAYVYKHQSSAFYAYSPDPSVVIGDGSSPKADLKLDNHQLFLSMGFRF